MGSQESQFRSGLTTAPGPMKDIYATDISEKKEFSAEGDILKQKYCHDREKQIWVYERYHNGRLMGYELVKGVKNKNPDGSIVYTYPSNEKFGQYGYFISRQWAENDIPKYLAILPGKGSKSIRVSTN